MDHRQSFQTTGLCQLSAVLSRTVPSRTKPHQPVRKRHPFDYGQAHCQSDVVALIIIMQPLRNYIRHLNFLPFEFTSFNGKARHAVTRSVTLSKPFHPQAFMRRKFGANILKRKICPVPENYSTNLRYYLLFLFFCRFGN